jgi:hypothetical protein
LIKIKTLFNDDSFLIVYSQFNYVSICIQNMLLDLLSYKWHSMSQMLVIPHRFTKVGLCNLVVPRIFSDILLVLGLKNVEKH